MTFKEFLDQHTWTDCARGMASLFLHIAVASEPYECSLLWFLWFVRQCGGTRVVFSATNGEMERKIKGGSQQISERIADRLGDNKVLINRPVVGVTQTGNQVVVKTIDGSEYRAKYLITGLAPAMQYEIHYNPPLLPLRNQPNQRYPMGSVIEAIVYYKTTFWRGKYYCV